MEQLAESMAESSPTAPELDAWMQLTHLLLAAVTDHAVRDGRTDLDLFRARIQTSAVALKDRPTPAQVLTIAGSLVQAIANYSGHAQRQIDFLQAEARSLQPRSGAAPIATPAPNVDACTGLPTRKEAEVAIERALAARFPTYMAVFYLHRMNLTNARFGAAIGDQIISFCSQHLTTSVIKTNDALYRWSGPAFVAILREESHRRVNEEVQRAASAPVSRFFETASRTVYLPIKLTGGVILTGNQTYTQVTDQIERFMLEASGAGTS